MVGGSGPGPTCGRKKAPPGGEGLFSRSKPATLFFHQAAAELHGSTAHENHVSAGGQLLQLEHRAGADSAGAGLHGAAREVDHRHLAGTGAQPKKPRPLATAAPPSPTTCKPGGTARATQSP